MTPAFSDHIMIEETKYTHYNLLSILKEIHVGGYHTPEEEYLINLGRRLSE